MPKSKANPSKAKAKEKAAKADAPAEPKSPTKARKAPAATGTDVASTKPTDAMSAAKAAMATVNPFGKKADR